MLSGEIHLAVANLDPHRAAQITVSIRGTTVGKMSGRLLTAPAINAINTFERPDAVQPAPFGDVRAQGNRLQLSVPAKSVVVLSQ